MKSFRKLLKGLKSFKLGYLEGKSEYRKNLVEGMSERKKKVEEERIKEEDFLAKGFFLLIIIFIVLVSVDVYLLNKIVQKELRSLQIHSKINYILSVKYNFFRCPFGTKPAGGNPMKTVFFRKWCHYQDKKGNFVRHGLYEAWYKSGQQMLSIAYWNGKEIPDQSFRWDEYGNIDK